MDLSYLGIDVGTTGCKVIAFDEEGRTVAQAYREYPLYQLNQGWIELDADEVFRSVEDCLQEVSNFYRGDYPVSLAISAQGEAVIPVDEKGGCLARSMVTFDERGDEFVPFWKEKLGEEKFLKLPECLSRGLERLIKFFGGKSILPIYFQKPAIFFATKILLYSDWD